LKIKKSLVVPIIFPSDINSVEMKNEKIAAIPLSGYYVKVVYDNYKQRVIKTANLY
jgi:cellobiose phosphorylase